MSVPVVAKFRRLLDSLPRETLPDIVASMIRISNDEKLQVRRVLPVCCPKFNLVAYTTKKNVVCVTCSTFDVLGLKQ